MHWSGHSRRTVTEALELERLLLPQQRSSVRLFGSLRCWPYSIGFAARYDRSWCSEPKAITRISLAAAWLTLTHLRWKTSAAPAFITCFSAHSSRRRWGLSLV